MIHAWHISGGTMGDHIADLFRACGEGVGFWVRVECEPESVLLPPTRAPETALKLLSSEREKQLFEGHSSRVLVTLFLDADQWTADTFEDGMVAHGFAMRRTEYEPPRCCINNAERTIDGRPLYLMTVRRIENDWPNMLAALGDVSCPFTYTLNFSFDTPSQREVAATIRRAHSGGLFPNSKASLRRLEQIEDFRVDAEEHGAVTLRGTFQCETEEAARAIKATLQRVGVTVEFDEYPLGSWLGTHPGETRRGVVKLQCIARTAMAMLPFEWPQGDVLDGFMFGFRRNGTVKSIRSSVLDPNDTRAAHSVIVGETGGGKSFLATAMWMHFLAADPNAQVFIFDHRMSSRPAVLACRGQFSTNPEPATHPRLCAWEIADGSRHCFARIANHIAERLDGRPTLIVVDEAHLFLCDAFNHLLQTSRKMNVAVCIITPKPESLLKTDFGDTIRQQCRKRFYVPNPGMSTASAYELGLDAEAFRAIRCGVLQRDLFVQDGEEFDKIELRAGPVLQALAGRISPDWQAKIDAGDDPLKWAMQCAV